MSIEYKKLECRDVTVYWASGKVQNYTLQKATSTHVQLSLDDYEGNWVSLHLIHDIVPAKSLDKKITRKSTTHKAKPRVKKKDGMWYCHFGHNPMKNIHAVGIGVIPEEAYLSWREANDKINIKKQEKKRQRTGN